MIDVSVGLLYPVHTHEPAPPTRFATEKSWKEILQMYCNLLQNHTLAYLQLSWGIFHLNANFFGRREVDR